MDKKILNLGSGNDNAVPNAVTVDKSVSAGSDIVHDLNVFPWPLEDNRFDEVHAYDVIEHLSDLVKAMEEIHRISKNGARLFISTPHYSCSNAYTDPTHIQRLGFFSFDYFSDENKLAYYSSVRFKKITSDIVFYPTWINRIVRRIAKRSPSYYERHLAWIFPAWYMKFELEVLK